jgi:glycosyltransferase involved in cell wall biosynthesis
VRLTTIGGCAAGSLEPGVTHLGQLDLKVERERALFESAYAKSTCLLHPAKFECYGHVLVEACARGLPVICTEVGGMPTIIEHEVNGLLLPSPPTVSAIEKAVCRLIDDPPLRIQLATNARLAWETRLSWACWSRTFLQLLD